MHLQPTPTEWSKPRQETLARALDVSLTAVCDDGVRARCLRDASAVGDLPGLAHVLARGGLAARTATLNPDDLLALTAASNAVLLPSDDGWLIARRGRLGRPRILHVTADGERSVKPTAAALRELLGEQEVTVVVVAQRFGLETLSRHVGVDHTPWSRARALLRLERPEVVSLAVYAVVLGGLSLAVPLSVQVLVTTIAFGSLLQPLVILSVLLFGVLAFTALLQILQMYATEVLQRRVFVRISEDFARRFPALALQVHDRIDPPALAMRFFEVVTLQKSLSQLLVSGLGLCLQTLVGMILLAFYHPWLLAFDVVLLLSLLTVVALGRGAAESAVAESTAKYQLAGWLGQVAHRSNLFARPDGQAASAIAGDALTRAYLGARKRHYARLLRQWIGGAVVSVFSMVVLLGMGGWLVMEGELTLGQLVAAELVVSAIAVGFARAGKYLEATYDMVAGLEKVGRVLDRPMLPPAIDNGGPPDATATVSLNGLRVALADGTAGPAVSTTIGPRARVRVTGRSGSGKSALLETLAGLREPMSGDVLARGDAGAHALLAHAYLVRPGDVVEGTVLDNLRLARPDLTEPQALQLLAKVGLHARVVAFRQGLHEPLGPGGAPFSSDNVARLSLARALAAQPGLLLLDGALDHLSLSQAEHEELLETVLGPDAPWSVALVTYREDVASLCTEQLVLTP